MATGPNGVIIYASRYGTTLQYAEWIRKELRIPLIVPERLDDQVLAACDFVIIATPVYRGEMLVREWLWYNQFRLRAKRVFLAIVCTHFADGEKRVTIMKDNIPIGISPEYYFLPGRLIVDALTTEDSRFLHLNATTEENRGNGDAVVTDATAMEESIMPLLESVRAFVDGSH